MWYYEYYVVHGGEVAIFFDIPDPTSVMTRMHWSSNKSKNHMILAQVLAQELFDIVKVEIDIIVFFFFLKKNQNKIKLISD